jgi:hypothetical protein
MKLSESSAGVLWALIILAVLALLPLIGMGVMMSLGGAMSGHMGGQMMGGEMMGGAMMGACALWGIVVAILLITLIVAAVRGLRSQTP